MKNKLKKQTYACIIIAIAMLISVTSDITTLKQGSNAIISYMNKDYTVEDIKRTLSSCADFASAMPEKVTSVINIIKGTPEMGEPIDPAYVAGQTDVYAVLGGDVTSSGENEEIGKYIRITHGSIGESLYGNLKSIDVEIPSRVKKGQKIGTFEQKEDEDFYYSFNEFN